MLLLSPGLLHLINKLSLVSNKNLLFPWANMMKSSKWGEWSPDVVAYATLNWRLTLLKFFFKQSQDHLTKFWDYVNNVVLGWNSLLGEKETENCLSEMWKSPVKEANFLLLSIKCLLLVASIHNSQFYTTHT